MQFTFKREKILKAIRLLLGIAYVQPKNVIGGVREGEKGSFSTGLGDLDGVAYVQPVTNQWQSVRRTYAYMCSVV